MEPWSGITAKDGRRFELGDEVRVVCRPDDAVFEGFLNEVTEDYIILASTGHEPVPGFGSSLGLLWPNIKSMAKIHDEANER